MNEELLKYVSQELDRGFSREQISQALADAGWQAHDIAQAFDIAQKLPAPPIPTASTPEQKPDLELTYKPELTPSLAVEQPIEPVLEELPTQIPDGQEIGPVFTHPKNEPTAPVKPVAKVRPVAKGMSKGVRITLSALIVLVLLAVFVGLGGLAAYLYLSGYAH